MSGRENYPKYYSAALGATIYEMQNRYLLGVKYAVSDLGFPLCTPGVDAKFYTPVKRYFFGQVLDPWTRPDRNPNSDPDLT